MCEWAEGLCRCVLQIRKFEPSTSVSQKEGPVCSQQEQNCKFTCKLLCCQSCHFVKGYPQTKGVNPVKCQNYIEIKHVKDVSCLGHLSSINLVTNVPTAAPDLLVGARLRQFWERWVALGASPKVVTVFREGYTLPSRFQP